MKVKSLLAAIISIVFAVVTTPAHAAVGVLLSDDELDHVYAGSWNNAWAGYFGSSREVSKVPGGEVWTSSKAAGEYLLRTPDFDLIMSKKSFDKIFSDALKSYFEQPSANTSSAVANVSASTPTVSEGEAASPESAPSTQLAATESPAESQDVPESTPQTVNVTAGEGAVVNYMDVSGQNNLTSLVNVVAQNSNVVVPVNIAVFINSSIGQLFQSNNIDVSSYTTHGF